MRSVKSKKPLLAVISFVSNADRPFVRLDELQADLVQHEKTKKKNSVMCVALGLRVLLCRFSLSGLLTTTTFVVPPPRPFHP